MASSIAMDKEISKNIFIKNKLNTPKFFTYSYDLKKTDLIKKINKKLKFPVVVKPLNEGSSVNVYICNKKNIVKILNSIKSYKKIIIEALWDIIYSDEDADMYETNLMRRLSGLLYLDPKVVGDIKEKVRQKKKHDLFS